MKCEIIRDLLPSYIEGLTSEESNQSIEDHLKTCPKCKKYFEEMQASITAPEIDAASKAEIQPFKKTEKENLESHWCYSDHLRPGLRRRNLLLQSRMDSII